MEQLVLYFLENEAKILGFTQSMMASKFYLDDSGHSQRILRKIIGVHLAAYFGLGEAITALLKNGNDPNVKDSNGRTPLSWTAINGHEAVMKLLLATDGVDPDSKDNSG